MHYTTHTTEKSKRLYIEVQKELWQERWHLVARTVWAASVILPILDAVAWVFRQVAMLDPSIRLHYELEEQQQAVFTRERQFHALGDSVREFAGFLLAVSYKQEADEGMSNEELHALRDRAFTNFCSHFAKSDPHDALLMATKAILRLYDICKIEDKPILEAFQAIEQHLMPQRPCDWLKDEVNNPLHVACTALIEGYERFHALSETS